MAGDNTNKSMSEKIKKIANKNNSNSNSFNNEERNVFFDEEDVAYKNQKLSTDKDFSNTLHDFDFSQKLSSAAENDRKQHNNYYNNRNNNQNNNDKNNSRQYKSNKQVAHQNNYEERNSVGGINNDKRKIEETAAYYPAEHNINYAAYSDNYDPSSISSYSSENIKNNHSPKTMYYSKGFNNYNPNQSYSKKSGSKTSFKWVLAFMVFMTIALFVTFMLSSKFSFQGLSANNSTSSAEVSKDAEKKITSFAEKFEDTYDDALNNNSFSAIKPLLTKDSKINGFESQFVTEVNKGGNIQYSTGEIKKISTSDKETYSVTLIRTYSVTYRDNSKKTLKGTYLYTLVINDSGVLLKDMKKNS